MTTKTILQIIAMNLLCKPDETKTIKNLISSRFEHVNIK
jgi:hypothetical protein